MFYGCSAIIKVKSCVLPVLQILWESWYFNFFFFPPTHPLRECSLWHCPKVCWPHGMCRPSHRRYNWWRAPGPGWSAAAWPYWQPPRIPSPPGLKEEGWREKRGNKRKEEPNFETICKKNREDIIGKRKKNGKEYVSISTCAYCPLQWVLSKHLQYLIANLVSLWASGWIAGAA